MKNNHITLSLLAMLTLSQTAAAASEKTIAGLSLLGGAGIVALKDTKIFHNFISSLTKNNRRAVGLAATGGFLLLPHKKIILGCGLIGAGIGYLVKSQQKAEDEVEAEAEAN